MKNVWKVAIFYVLTALSTFMLPCQLCGQEVERHAIHVTLVGFADRWADYGSRGDIPGFRDFLAVLHQPGSGGTPREVFIKLRLLYWGQGKSDPKSMSEGKQQERVFDAKRDSTCDEDFASLRHEGDVSYLDPKLKPSRFERIRGSLTNLPPPQASLPCYEVK